MSYTLNSLRNEITNIIQNDEAPIELNPAWITQAIMAAHDDGSVTGFHAFAARAYVRAEVSKFIGRMKNDAEQSVLQMVMPGFEVLQERYPVKKGDGIVLIRTDHMTAAQLDEKITEYEAMRDGLTNHIRELRAYRKAKFGGQVAEVSHG